MTISFKDQTATVVRPAWVDERGDLIEDWSNAAEHDIDGCRLQPMATDEVLFSGATDSEGGVARNAVVIRWKLFLPDGADIEAHDRIRFRSELYEVDGEPLRWESPTGFLAHVETVLRRVEG